MAKILIIFGSGEGQTAKVAETIGKRIRGRGHDVDVFNGKSIPRGFDVEQYAAIIVAASVRKQKYQRYIVNFAKKYRARLDSVPSAFVSVSMAAARSSDPKSGILKVWLDQFITKTGWNPAHFASFAGALMYRKYNFFIRFTMKKISQKSGLPTDTSRNHEFTDWDAVGHFADEFADTLANS